MKSRRAIRFLSCFAAVWFAVSAASCSGDTLPTGEVEIWSTYNTTKIMREKYDYVKLDARIDVEMAKSETEGAQIIFTPDYNVRSYDLALSDLHSGENVFPKENIAVYKQGYVNVTSKTPNQQNTAYPVGWTADFMLPLEKAQEYGETTVSAGHNQGLTVEFSSLSETPAGTYTGTFSLVIDGVSTEIPVSVTVWDIDISAVYGKSCFGYSYSNDFMQGELSNTKETAEAFYEFLLDNRISPSDFPPGPEATPEEFVEEFQKYCHHKYFSSFGFPVRRGSSKYTVNYESLYQYVKPIAQLCTPEENWMEMAYYYLVPIDEPATQDDFNAVDAYREGIDGMEERIISELKEEGFYDSLLQKGYTQEETDAFRTELEESIRSIPQVVTTPYNDNLKERVNTYCPPIQYYDTEYERREYAENAEINGSEQWFYTCMQPIYPYPSFHIDDYLIGARIQKWMQAAYDVEGYLFWDAAAYKNVSQDIVVDPYTDPNRFYYGSTPFPGDGYLTYPGYKYGERKPFGSLRLAAYRDGQEDMDLIGAFDSLLQSYEEYYGAQVSANDVLQGEYAKIFTGAVYNESDAQFYSVRRTVAKLYGYAASDAKLIIGNSNITGTTVTTEIYAAAGYTLKVNGAEVAAQESGSGSKFVITDDLSAKSVSYELELYDPDGKKCAEYERFVSDQIHSATLSENAVSVSEGSAFTVAEGKAEFEIVSKTEGEFFELASFVPMFRLGQDCFGVSVSQLEEISFTLVNDTDTDLTLSVCISSGNRRSELTKVVVPAHSAEEYTVSGIASSGIDGLASADGFAFAFENLDENSKPYPVRRLTLQNVYYVIA